MLSSLPQSSFRNQITLEWHTHFKIPGNSFTGVPPHQLSTNEQIFSKSLPVVWGKQPSFLGTFDFAYIEESNDKMKKSSKKTFVTRCQIRQESLRNHLRFHSESQKFFSKSFSFCRCFLRYRRNRMYQEIKHAFLTQLEEICWRFVRLLITDEEGLPWKSCQGFRLAKSTRVISHGRSFCVPWRALAQMLSSRQSIVATNLNQRQMKKKAISLELWWNWFLLRLTPKEIIDKT